jgi:hypothetical protein
MPAVRWGGSGTVGALTVDGGVLAPGGSPGVLTCSNLNLVRSSRLEVEINGPTVGTGYDQVNVRGTVTISNATLRVTVGYTPAVGAKFTIIKNDGLEAVAGTFTGLREGASFKVGAVTFQISYGTLANDVVLTVTAVDSLPPLTLLSPQPAGSNLLLRWTGGAPAYVVEKKTDLTTNANWVLVLTNGGTNATVPLDTSSGFYRVRGGN